jgi:glycosyltransferase involved in cell wall biosynthesis
VGVLVSIVVPVFNGLPHLRELTESLLAQDYPDLEIVFSEGGSTDESPAYLASLIDPRVRVITMPPGTSAAGNWTAVSEAAKGELVKLVCQDDLLKPFAVSRQVSALQVNPSAVMAIAQRDIVDARGDVLYPSRGCAGLQPGLVDGAKVIRTCYLQGTNVVGEPLAVLFRREPFLESMPWVDSNPLVLDLHMYEKVAALGDVVVDKTSIGGFRVSTSSWSTRLAGVQRHQFEKWQADYAASLPQAPTALQRSRARAGVWTQTMLRLAAYRWLRLKGSFTS